MPDAHDYLLRITFEDGRERPLLRIHRLDGAWPLATPEGDANNTTEAVASLIALLYLAFADDLRLLAVLRAAGIVVTAMDGPPGEYPGGLYVYEVEYDPDSASDSDDPDEAWQHLRGGRIRRPTAKELAPLAEGRAPWGGEVL